MSKWFATVETELSIEVDESKFTEEWMEDFRKVFYPFRTVQDHIEHLCLLQARGVIELPFTEFVEGYGNPADMGIRIVTIDVEVDRIGKFPVQ